MLRRVNDFGPCKPKYLPDHTLGHDRLNRNLAGETAGSVERVANLAGWWLEATISSVAVYRYPQRSTDIR